MYSLVVADPEIVTLRDFMFPCSWIFKVSASIGNSLDLKAGRYRIMIFFNSERLEHYPNQYNGKSNITGELERKKKVSNEVRFTKISITIAR